MKRQLFLVLLFLGSMVGSTIAMYAPDMGMFAQQNRFGNQQNPHMRYPRLRNNLQHPMYNPYAMMMQQPGMYGMMNPFKDNKKNKLSLTQYAINELTVGMMQNKPLSESMNRIVDYSISNISSYCKSWWLQAIVLGALNHLKMSTLPQLAKLID